MRPSKRSGRFEKNILKAARRNGTHNRRASGSLAGHDPKTKGAALLLASSAVLFAACSSSSSPKASKAGASSRTTGSAAGASPIVIGAILSVSGAYASLGAPEERALQAFQASGMKANGRPIQFQIINDNSSAIQAVAAARTLVSDHVAGIIGPSVTETMDAAFPVIVAANVPNIILTLIPYPNYNKEPFIFGPNEPPLPTQEQYFEKSLGKLGCTKTLIWSQDDATGQAIGKIYKSAPNTTVQLISAGLSDYTPVVSAWKAAGYNCIGAETSVVSLAATLRKAEAQLNYNVPNIVAPSVFTSQLFQLAGSAANGLYGFVQPGVFPPATLQPAALAQVVEQAQSLYQKYTGHTITNDQPAMWAWDCALSFQKAIQAAGSTDPQQVAQALASQTLWGVGGQISRSSTDHTGYQWGSSVLATVKDGEYANLGPIASSS